uniref:Uncharacterized protein n=1 Tax=Pipistrellus kuhlii TaxID=59472 RepID=A0A7J7T1E3_PIPKU|nr:hypothetical protein mPipKuh1_009733 [Pipistrellus kuhlii]
MLRVACDRCSVVMSGQVPSAMQPEGLGEAPRAGKRTRSPSVGGDGAAPSPCHQGLAKTPARPTMSMAQAFVLKSVRKEGPAGVAQWLTCDPGQGSIPGQSTCRFAGSIPSVRRAGGSQPMVLSLR